MCEAKKKIGLVGLGDHMFHRLYPAAAGLPIRTVAVCDWKEERRRRFLDFYHAEREYEDFREMIRREALDGVICAGGARLHYEVAKECMSHGVSGFVEKTPCETWAQAEELKALEEETGRFTMVGFNRRFATAYRMAKEIIGRKEFGRPLFYMAKYHASPYPSDEYFLFNHVIHHLDLARYLMGEIREIDARGISGGKEKNGYHIRFVTESGALGMIESTSFQREPYPMERVEITGDGRNVIVDNVNDLEYNRPAPDKRADDPALWEGGDALSWNHNQGHSSLYGHYGFERGLKLFTEALAGRRRPEAHFREIAPTMKLYEQVKESCERIQTKGGV